MTARLFCALIILLLASPAWAVTISEELIHDGELVQSWIVVVRDGSSDMILADREKTADGYTIKADIGALHDKDLIAALALSSKGEVVSSPLHNYSRNELERESLKLAQQKIPSLEKELLVARERLSTLEGDIKIANLKRRKEQGFDEVDRIYEQIAIIEEQIENIKRNRQSGL